MGSTQVVWQNLYMVFWGLAALIFVLGFIQHIVDSSERWPYAIATMGLLVGLATVYPNATTSFMNMNETVCESIYPSGTNVSDLYTYMKNVKTKESSDSSWTADLRGVATYPIRKAIDEVLEYVCRTCIFVGELASGIALAIIVFTFKLFKVVSPLLISFCGLRYTQSAGVRFLTLSLGLCLAPYAFVAADFMLIEIFSSLNTLVTNTILNNNAAAIVAVVADNATSVAPGSSTLMQIGSYLILSVVLGLMSIFVYLGAPACLLLLLSGESPANAAIVAAMAGGQTIQTLTGSAGDIANVGVNLANAGSKSSGESSGASAGVPLGVTEPLASTPVAGTSASAATDASSVGATATAGAGATAATGGLAAPLAVAATAASAAVQTAETATKVAQQTVSSAMETASSHGASVDGAIVNGPSLVPSSSASTSSAIISEAQNSSSSAASSVSASSNEASSSTSYESESSASGSLQSASAPAPFSFNTSFADNPSILADELRNAVETAKTEIPIPSEQPIEPDGYNRRKR